MCQRGGKVWKRGYVSVKYINMQRGEKELRPVDMKYVNSSEDNKDLGRIVLLCPYFYLGRKSLDT